MSDIAIRVENLSKMYRIGRAKQRHDTLRDLIADTLRSSFRGRDGSPQEETIWALKDVSFEVKRGDVVGVIGPNGAGKSTLLKILSRIVEPTGGSFDLYGRVGSLLEVGTGFHPELTGRENVYLSGAILGMGKAEINRRFDEIVDFSGVEKFLDTPVKRYSSGMQVRLAFAVAAHLEPEVMLVDEVLAVGDAEFQKKCVGKMQTVAGEGRTVVYVSHNLHSVKTLCSKGILLESGKQSTIVSMSDVPLPSMTAVIDQYLSSEREQRGEVCWASPDVAPGNERARLKAVRIVSEGRATGEVDISKEFHIEIDYWNLEANRRRLVSVHLHNSMGTTLLTSSNMTSVCLVADPWYSRPYPTGLFRTSCTIPGNFLNDGQHDITVYVNGKEVADTIIRADNVLTFTVRDTGEMREEYTGPWTGAVRPRLHWESTQLS